MLLQPVSRRLGLHTDPRPSCLQFLYMLRELAWMYMNRIRPRAA